MAEEKSRREELEEFGLSLLEMGDSIEELKNAAQTLLRLSGQWGDDIELEDEDPEALRQRQIESWKQEREREKQRQKESDERFYQLLAEIRSLREQDQS